MMSDVNYIQSKTGSEIARELNISRQAASQLLKRAISKVYDEILDQFVCDTPTEAIMFMQNWFGVEDDVDIQQFLDLFPKRIKDEIKLDARNYSTGK